MRTIDRIDRIVTRFMEDPAGIDVEVVLGDIMKTLRNSVILVQDLGSVGLHAELHESKANAIRALGRYVKSEWCGRDGPGVEVARPRSPKKAIDIYYNVDLGGRENYEQYDIVKP